MMKTGEIVSINAWEVEGRPTTINTTNIRLRLKQQFASKEDLIKAIKAASTLYCQTDDGKKTYEENCNAFNWGDFDLNVPNRICLAYGFEKLDETDTHNIEVDFNEQLVKPDAVFPDRK